MKTAHEITRILLAEYFAGQPERIRKEAETRLEGLAAGALRREARPYRDRLQRLIRPVRDDLIPRAPPEVSAWLERTLTGPALLDWAMEALDPAALGIAPDEFGQRVKDWFAGLSTARQAEFIGAALRRSIGQTSQADGELRKTFAAALTPKENKMASPPIATNISFAPDTRGLPASLLDFDPVTPGPGWKAWYKAVSDGITNFGLKYDAHDQVSAATYAAVTGMLLYDGQTDQNNAAFQPAKKSA